jgi:hypothetical protein
LYFTTNEEKEDLLISLGKYLDFRKYLKYFINLFLFEDTFIELKLFYPDDQTEKIEFPGDEKKRTYKCSKRYTDLFKYSYIYMTKNNREKILYGNK